MKKWFVIALVCGGLYYYAAHTENGEKRFVQSTQWFQQLTAQKTPDFSPGGDKTTVYKVQNPDGSWTYSNRKPADNAKVIEQEYRSDTNVLPAPADKTSNTND